MSLFLPTSDPLACRHCGGLTEVAVPDREGRVQPWARTEICLPCSGTGKTGCGVCGTPGSATHLDEGGQPECDGCAVVVGLEQASGDPAGVGGAA